MIIELKERLNDPNFDVSKLDDTIFENILNRRILLSKKIMILEKFLAIYRKCKINDNLYDINGIKFNLKEFLWSLKFSSNSEGESVNEESVLKTRRYLDDYFDFEKAIIYSCPIEKKNAILADLDKDVDLEEYYDDKTEHVLQMLKKFLVLKENVLNNKKKYKFILYILTKVKKDNAQTVSLESIQHLIKDLNIDEIMQSNDFNLSESEISELENFDQTEKLLQDIEIQLFKHVDDVIAGINK